MKNRLVLLPRCAGPLIVLAFLQSAAARGPAQDDADTNKVTKSPTPAVSHNFIVVPVETDFQASQLNDDNIVAYANIEAKAFIDPDTKEAIPGRFDFDAFRKALSDVRQKAKNGKLWLKVDYLDAQCSLKTKKNIERDLRTMADDAGFKSVRYTSRYTNAKYKWYGLPQVDEEPQDEPQMGNEAVSVYPVRTPLGKYLAGQGVAAVRDCDCFIEVRELLPINSGRIFSGANKGVVRNALLKMEVPENASAVLRVGLEPRGDRQEWRNLPQTKQGAEFHRDAVDFLRLMGFTRIKVEVVIDSTWFNSDYK